MNRNLLAALPPRCLSASRWIIALVLTLAVAGGIKLFSGLPDVRVLRTINPEQTSMMRYRAEQPSGAQAPSPRGFHWAELSKISPNLTRAVIAAEDADFFKHRGFDWESIWNALLLNVRQQRIIKGGSGITQQLAKNLYLEPTRSFFRKIREVLITYRLEQELSKLRILELYLNVVEFGPGVYGAEAAAQAYFHKPAAQLGLPEAISLASVLPNPTLTSLTESSPELLKRQQEIAAALLHKGWISAANHDLVLQQLARHVPHTGERPPAIVQPAETSPRFLNPDYWISRLSAPDTELMTGDQIRSFNERALITGGGIDLSGLPAAIPRQDVLAKIFEVAGISAVWSALNCYTVNASRTGVVGHRLLPGSPPADAALATPERYDRNNKVLTRDDYCRLLSKLNLDQIPERVTTRYALVITRSNVLAWPVDDFIMGKPDDYDFNILQQSSVHTGAPIAVLHASKDGKWAFVRSSYFDGWIRRDHLAWTTREEAARFPGTRFLVVTASSQPTDTGADLEMGTLIPLVKRSGNGFEARVPRRGTDGNLVFADTFLPSEGVTEGFLPYTRRNVIMQAFKLQGEPYGWGGSKLGRDCSGFVQDVFSVFGIRFPRNSAAQMEVSEELVDARALADRKAATVSRWAPASTLLGLPGHIMLYLGQGDGKPYVIHALWGVTNSEDRLIKINRVAVTDLELGAGGKKGSLFERISSVRAVDLKRTDLSSLIDSFMVWLFSRRMLLLGLSLLMVVSISWIALGLAVRKLAERSR